MRARTAHKGAMPKEGRPSFAAGFPDDPALDALVRAFAEGDFARIRVEAPKLAESSDDPAVKSAARELRARIEPDRLALVLMGFAGALLVALSAWWVAHGRAPITPAPSGPAGTPAATIERIR